MTHGSLFSGIGGFDLGFAWAGIETLWDVEIDPYAQKVLRKNFPNTEIYTDVREVGKHNLASVDILSGGFPCQDISVAGKQAGIADGTRSGLWSEFHRIISELRPRYVVIENVANLLVLGLERVLCDLAEIGYDAEWQIISARDIGAPHRRNRVWIVAYPQHTDPDSLGSHREEIDINGSFELRDQQIGESGQVCEDVADAIGNSEGGAYRSDIRQRVEGRHGSDSCERNEMGSDVGNGSENVSDTNKQGLQGNGKRGADTGREDSERHARQSGGARDYWSTEPNVGRVANGIPKRVDRLKGLGNAVVPQVPYIIGKAILQAERA